MFNFLLLLATESAAAVEAATIPVWGWYTIVGALASAVVTLGSLYVKARDREVASEASKSALIQEVGGQQTKLLVSAIEAFTLSRTGSDQLNSKLTELVTEMRELKSIVRELQHEVEK